MERNPVLERLLLELRDPSTDRPSFRRALQAVGYHLGTEVAKDLPTERRGVRTLMGKDAYHDVVAEDPALICLLRAGLPLYQGVQDAFPYAEAGFIGTSRDEGTLRSRIDYVAIPEIKDKTVLLIDTMLATGGSVSDVAALINPLSEAALFVRPYAERVIVVGAFGSLEGVTRLKKEGLEVYAAVVDPELNFYGYILPGLGDAGDRCFGKKSHMDFLREPR